MNIYRIYYVLDGEALVSSFFEANTPREAVNKAVFEGIRKEDINSVYLSIPDSQWN